ncbi:MAG: RHS repeat-associated core domain-containing protein, partial [Candidatus Bipolaricaulis sp.]|nr:RHS repeat-associated core domain-containing protein [Candidatus Bipolaricaulis sp.]
MEATGRELTSLQLPTHEDFPNNIPVPNTAANAMQNYEQQFTYDELGNILQMKSVGQWTRDYFYNTNDNKLLGHTNGATEYTYDNHGNITAMPHLTQMDWDFKNQLHGATNGTFISYYVYDAAGNRVRKVVVKGNITEERYYLGNYEVFRKTNNGTLEIERSTVFVSDDKKKIAQIDDDGTTETIRYQYDNHLGSASLELDQNAAIISYEEYHPFGTTSYRSGRTETEVSLKRYKYVGKEWDEETGLYNYGFRMYAAWLGRFVSVDPMAHERSWLNPYNYCQNNPINRTDPMGALDEDPRQTMERMTPKSAGSLAPENTTEFKLKQRDGYIEKIVGKSAGVLAPESNLTFSNKEATYEKGFKTKKDLDTANKYISLATKKRDKYLPMVENLKPKVDDILKKKDRSADEQKILNDYSIANWAV